MRFAVIYSPARIATGTGEAALICSCLNREHCPSCLVYCLFYLFVILPRAPFLRPNVKLARPRFFDGPFPPDAIFIGIATVLHRMSPHVSLFKLAGLGLGVVGAGPRIGAYGIRSVAGNATVRKIERHGHLPFGAAPAGVVVKSFPVAAGEVGVLFGGRHSPTR